MATRYRNQKLNGIPIYALVSSGPKVMYGSPKAIAIITMQFPGETFAVSDITALEQKTLSLDVFCLRPKSSSGKTRASAYWGDAKHIHHPSVTGLLSVIKKPKLFYYWGQIFLRIVILEKLSLKNRFRVCISLLASLSIIGKIAQLNPDVVHAFWGHHPALPLLPLKKYLQGTVVSSFLGAYDLTCRRSISNLTTGCLDAYFTHCEANRAKVEEQSGEKPVYVIYRGINVEHVPSIKALKKRKHNNRVIIVNNLLATKRTEMAIYAFASATIRNSTLELVVVGDGPEIGRLKEHVRHLGIEQHVVFKGRLPQERVIKELSESKIYINLSEKPGERLPNAAKEAMACACVCIVNRTPGIAELISDEDDGFIVDADETEKIAGIIDDYAYAPSLNSVSLRARQAIFERFDVQEKSDQYVDAWARVAALKKAKR